MLFLIFNAQLYFDLSDPESSCNLYFMADMFNISLLGCLEKIHMCLKFALQRFHLRITFCLSE